MSDQQFTPILVLVDERHDARDIARRLASEGVRSTVFENEQELLAAFGFEPQEIDENLERMRLAAKARFDLPKSSYDILLSIIAYSVAGIALKIGVPPLKKE